MSEVKLPEGSIVVELDPEKQYLICLNHRQVTEENAHHLMKAMSRVGIHRSLAFMVDGDITTAVKIIQEER